MPSIIGNGEGRQGSVSIVRNSGRNTVRNKVHYDVLADSATQQRDQIVQAAGLPIVGLTIDPLYGFCVSLNAVRDVNRVDLWHLEFEFSSEAEEGGQQLGDPTLWVPQAEIQFEVLEEVVRYDQSTPAKPWMNSAKQPFETGLTIPKTVLRRDWAQFEPASTTIDTIEDRNNKINSATYLGRDAKTLLLQIRGAKLGTYYNTRCWLIDYSMKYKEDTWTLKMLDVGYSYLTGSGATAKRHSYFDEDSQAIIQGALNGSGGKVTNADDDPYTLEFERYKTLDFSTFLRFTS